MRHLYSKNTCTHSLKQDLCHRSYWLDNLPKHQGTSPLRGSNRCDVAIIGGGFTGLSTAFHTRNLLPGADVRVLEANLCAFGSSGRNAGFSSTLFGMAKGLTVSRFGKYNAIAAHHYMEDAVDYVGKIVHEHGIDCSYEQKGSMLIATTKSQEKRVENELRTIESLGLKGFEAWDKARLSREFNTRHYRYGMFEHRTALLNPALLAFGLMRIAKQAGAVIHEMSPVRLIEEKATGFYIRTPEGELYADRLVYATNAYSILFPSLLSKQAPILQHIVLSEPLTDTQLESIGWQSRCGLDDARSQLHYYRLTADNRILIGGGDITPVLGCKFNYESNPKVLSHLKHYVTDIYPQLKGLKFTHHWGGPVSISVDMAPVVGYLGSKRRAVFSLGLMGHGVSMAPYNGLCIAELLANKKSKRTDMFFVGRRTICWPPQAIRFAMLQAVRGLLKLGDRLFLD